MTPRPLLLFSVALLLLAGCTTSDTIPEDITIEYTPPAAFEQVEAEEDLTTTVYRAGDGDTITYTQQAHDRSPEEFFSEETLQANNRLYSGQNGEGHVDGPHVVAFQGVQWLTMNVSSGGETQKAAVFATADGDTIHQFALYASGSNVETRYSSFVASMRGVTVTAR